MKTPLLFMYLCLASSLTGLMLTLPCHAGDTAKDEEAIKALVAALTKP
jgi:hypothetical protein